VLDIEEDGNTMLKFLFEAHFSDGSQIQQTPEDISATDPTKSAFYDVAQRLDDVVYFGIFNPSRPTETYVVDLKNGHFEICGVPITAHQQSAENFPPDTKFRLVYFRKVTRHFNPADMLETGVEMAFHIGWQCTVDGKNVQQTIAVR
jgi:hypothetical protein